MSSEAFETREDDYRVLYNTLNKKLTDQVPKLVGEERKKLIRSVERGLEDATILIQEMEEEMKGAPQPYRTQMSSRVRTYKADLENLTRLIRQTSQTPAGRENFSFSREDDFESMASSQRSRLLGGSDVLTRTSDSIARSQRIAAETDEIGHGIISELGEQREQLVRTRDRLHETDAELSQSRKILKGMARRVMTNKVVLIFIIVLEFAILGGLVYWKFFS